MKTAAIGLFTLIATALLQPAVASAHCQIPCGIYGDEERLKLLEEHIATIEKSMKAIAELQAAKSIDYNQLVRWVDNKEQHAQMIQDEVAQYWMTQRIKVDDKDAVKKLVVLHKLLVGAMKCKQTTDLKNVETVRGSLKEFRDLYFSADKK
jgi:nickel superoxide dismutase